MQLKRVRGASVREALAAVRADLGPDALVLSTQWVPATGLRGLVGQRDVEIMAAIDAELSGHRHRPQMEEETEAQMRPQMQPQMQPQMTQMAQIGQPGRVKPQMAQKAQMGQSRPQMPQMGQSKPQMAQMAQMAAISLEDRATDTHDEALVARLCAAGLDRAMALSVVEVLPRRSRRSASLQALREALSSRLAPMAAGGEERASIEVFVGPPGAGKTTTIAKLAAQARARRGARLSLLAADGFRVGAVEQLRLYSEIIGSPFSVARTAADIEAAVTTLRGPVLVDTAGRSPSDGALTDVFAALAGRKGVRTHLVMPASLSSRQAERLLDRYDAARPNRVVLTRTDEADNWASLLPVLNARGLTLSFLGTGQRVPDDLVSVTPDVLAGAVLGDGEGAAA